jgi:hypothetical protein
LAVTRHRRHPIRAHRSSPHSGRLAASGRGGGAEQPQVVRGQRFDHRILTEMRDGTRAEGSSAGTIVE